MLRHEKRTACDVLVIGGGLIGLASAIAIADGGRSVLLIARSKPGEASRAAAGLLSPSVETAEGPAHDFAVAARDAYPEYLDRLFARTGERVPLNREGVLQVALDERGVRGLKRGLPPTATWLEMDELRAIEPALAHAAGAALHPNDGAVDNVALHSVLRGLAPRHSSLTMIEDEVTAVDFRSAAVLVHTDTGATYEAGRVVLAAGAWSSRIRGLPRPLPVEPIRGQMLAYRATPIVHAAYGPTGYLVPREHGVTLVGSTMEDVGFEVATTFEGLDKLRRTAMEICPAFRETPEHSAWAGLRPVTPDLLPILCVDPSEPSLIYACGHSRNGVLMTPLTAVCVAALVRGDRPPADVSVFGLDRFEDMRADGVTLPRNH